MLALSITMCDAVRYAPFGPLPDEVRLLYVSRFANLSPKESRHGGP